MPTTYPIIKGNQYFDATTYTGNGSSQSIVNAGGMKPDFIWIKNRTTAGDYHNLFNSVVGASKYLASNSTDAEASNNNLTSFNSNGFTVPSANDTNRSGASFIGWQWRASNASAVSNTDGTITSSVSANTTSGFSIVTYTGTGANATAGHGLGVAPKMVIVKKRSAADSWQVYHASLTSAAYRLVLNDTAAQTSTPTIWNSTAPTSTVFSIGTDSGVNTNTGTYVAYCFAEINGYSKFGSYTGNGSSDGPFIYTGFRPRYVMMKRTDNVSDWSVYDTARNTYNTENLILYPNLSNAEETNNNRTVDGLSNGFKVRSIGDTTNANGGSYIYMAFAEMPTKYANAR